MQEQVQLSQEQINRILAGEVCIDGNGDRVRYVGRRLSDYVFMCVDLDNVSSPTPRYYRTPTTFYGSGESYMWDIVRLEADVPKLSTKFNLERALQGHKFHNDFRREIKILKDLREEYPSEEFPFVIMSPADGGVDVDQVRESYFDDCEMQEPYLENLTENPTC